MTTSDHLIQTGAAAVLAGLLEAQAGGGVPGLLAACAAAAGMPEQGGWHEVAAALRLAAHVLADDPAQLAGQLAGRLGGSADPLVAGLVAEAMAWRGAPWLCPVGGGLARPGGALVATMLGGRSHLPVALTPDGCVALVGQGELVELIDLDTMAVTGTLEGHDGRVRAIAMAPDGRWALTGSSDGTVRLWDLERRVPWGVLEGHSDWVRAVAADPDALVAVSGADDGTVRVWDLEHMAPAAVLEGHGDWVRAVAVTADRRLAVSGGDDHRVRLWDLAGGGQVASYNAQAQVDALALEPRAGLVLAAARSRLLLLRLEDLTEVGRLEGHSDWVRALAVTADGRTLFSAADDGTVRTWDLAERAERQVVRHGDWLESVAITPDGRTCLSAARDRTVKLWRMDRAPRAAHWSAPPALDTLVLTADGRFAVGGGRSGGPRVWDLGNGEVVARFPEHDGAVTGLAVAPGGERVLVASFGSSQLLDLRHLAMVDGDLGPLPGLDTGRTTTTALTPDGRVAVTVSPAGLLRLWDWPNLVVVASAEGPGKCAVAALDPAGGRAATGHGCSVLLWALGEAPAVAASFGADQAVQAIAVAAAGAGPTDLVAGDVGGSLHRLRLVTP